MCVCVCVYGMLLHMALIRGVLVSRTGTMNVRDGEMRYQCPRCRLQVRWPDEARRTTRLACVYSNNLLGYKRHHRCLQGSSTRAIMLRVTSWHAR